MPKVSKIEILKPREQHALTVRTTTKVENLPMLIGQTYDKMCKYVEEMGEYLTDVPYVAYYNMDMENLDVEMGFPVSKKLADKEDMKSVIIPEDYAIFCMYRGPYAEMGPVYEEMTKWIEDNGYRPKMPVYEYYYNSPEVPESELLTKILMPVEKA
ncbi:GyrI-like domain-containing protein [Anaerosacchariphilus polymeriproducens]|uniref:AraC family transcriptional regulator n=1 Tax=Anaerosacchariphilus polymeriproducens TaxID=1812858 RepID=A0A371AYT6_9FIRM|nr:GyrI-like domain-containing protein [Anaerosacchariphilus polymeriproducens]RDU24721.1 AraC family transcriptional regulator [Anaerosacchariphilus polymeriproducens]